MSAGVTFGLLLAVVLTIAPHAQHAPLWVISICSALLLWRAYLATSGKPLPGRWLLLPLTLFCMGGILIDFHTLFGREVGVALLMLLASLKLLELRTARDAMALIYLACFILITNFFYSQSIPVGLYMLATLFVIMTTWVHLYAPNIALRPRLRTAATLLGQAAPLTLILFILFPRVPGPLWGLPQDAYARSGLGDTMAPGSFSRLILSDAVAFRVSFQGAAPPRDRMYWRGPVLWHYDGRTWTRGRATAAIVPQFSDLAQPVDYRVTLEPHDKTWLFALEMPASVSIPTRLSADFQLLRRTPVTALLRYDVRSYLDYHANVHEAAGQLQRALQLPEERDPRARQLAARWRAAATSDTAVIRDALAYFRQQSFRYTLEPLPVGVNGVDDFLFRTHEGFCEHYASAFVFLMRAAHIPARVVTGYQGGEYNSIGNYYIVRQSDAHAWAEVWLAGQGWVRVDPTAAAAPARVESGLAAALPDTAALPFMARNPPAWLLRLRLNWDAVVNRWNQWVVGYDSETQFAFLTRLGMESVTWQKLALNLAAALGLVLGLVTLFLLRHLLARRPDRVQVAWLRLCRNLARAGLPRAPHESALNYAARIAAARPELAPAMLDLAYRYNALRYGAAPAPAARREFIRRSLKFRFRRLFGGLRRSAPPA